MDNLLSSPWFAPAVIIGVATLIVSITAVIISVRQKKPGLHVRIIQCKHKVRYVSGPSKKGEIAGTEVVVNFEIGNTGETTSIHEVEIMCNPLKQVYRTTERVQAESAIVIEKGKEVNYRHQFYISRRGIFENPLKCTFFLHYTHGKKKVKTESCLREK